MASLCTDFSQCCQAGPSQLWAIYNASTKQGMKKTSVWLYKKQMPVKLKSKINHMSIEDVLRKDIETLSGLHHQRVLRVMHVLHEHKESMSFATEPIMGSLRAIYANHDAAKKLGDVFDEIELKCGLLQICEGLSFLHNIRLRTYGNLTPDTIFVTNHCTWKLGSFAFSERCEGNGRCTSKKWTDTIPAIYQPDLDFMAFECNTQTHCSYLSDIFSFGALICWLHRHKIIQSNNSLQTWGQAIEKAQQHFNEVRGSMNQSLAEAVYKMLSKRTDDRPPSQLFALITYFDDPIVSTLQQLDELHNKDSASRTHFLTATLPESLAKMPERLWFGRVMVHLQGEIEANPSACARPTLHMLANCDGNNIAKLQPMVDALVHKARLDDQALVCALLDNLPAIMIRLGNKSLQRPLYNLVIDALEADDVQLRAAALDGVTKICEYIDEEFLKLRLLPTLNKVLVNKSLQAHLHVLVLNLLHALLQAINPNLVDKLTVIVRHIHSNEPQMVVATAKFYEQLIVNFERLQITPQFVISDMIQPLSELLLLCQTSHHFSEVLSCLRYVTDFIEKYQYSYVFNEPLPPSRSLTSVTGLLPQVCVHSPSDDCQRSAKFDGSRSSNIGQRRSSLFDFVPRCTSSRRESNASSASLQSARSYSPTMMAGRLPNRGDNCTLSLRRTSFQRLPEESIDDTALFRALRNNTIRNGKHHLTTPTYGRRHSSVGATHLGDTPSSLANLSHNLACTFFKK